MRLFGSSGSKKKKAEGPKESIYKCGVPLGNARKYENIWTIKLRKKPNLPGPTPPPTRIKPSWHLSGENSTKFNRRIFGARFNLETQIMTIENAHINLETLQAMQAGSSAMKSIHGELDIDKVDDVMEEVREQMDLANEISQAISNPLGMTGLMRMNLKPNEIRTGST